MRDLGRTDPAQQGCNFAQRHGPAIGSDDRSAFDRFGIARFQAAHDHAHPLAVRHIFAEIEAVAHGPHRPADFLAGHAKLGNPPVIRGEPQFGDDDIGIGIGPDHRAGNGGIDRIGGDQSCLSQRFVILRLQIEFDTAVAAKIAEQAALLGKGLDIGEAGENLVVDDIGHLFDARLVFDPDSGIQAPGIDEQIIVEQFGLLLALEIGVQPLNDLFGDFGARRFQCLARRQPDPGIDGITLHVRQIVGLWPEQIGDDQWRQDQRRDPDPALAVAVDQAENPVRIAIPAAFIVIHVEIAGEAPRGRRQYGNRDDQAGDHRNRNGQGQIGEQLSFDILDEHDRDEDRHGGRGRCEQGRPDLLDRFQRGRAGGRALFADTDKIFHHDDRRVEHHAGGKGEAGQRNNVDRATRHAQNR